MKLYKAMSGEEEEVELEKFNPNHGAGGKFSSSGAGSSGEASEKASTYEGHAAAVDHHNAMMDAHVASGGARTDAKYQAHFAAAQAHKEARDGFRFGATKENQQASSSYAQAQSKTANKPAPKSRLEREADYEDKQHNRPKD